MNGQDLKYFVAEPRHAAQASALINSAFRGDKGKQGWTTDFDLLDGKRITPELFIESLSPTSIVLLFGEENNPISSVNIEKLERDAYIGLFAVSPLFQNTGIGKRVLKIAEEYAIKTWGMEYVKITVVAQRTELISFYERRGYINTGETSAFPYGDEQFGIPKRDDLSFVYLKKKLVE